MHPALPTKAGTDTHKLLSFPFIKALDLSLMSSQAKFNNWMYYTLSHHPSLQFSKPLSIPSLCLHTSHYLHNTLPFLPLYIAPRKPALRMSDLPHQNSRKNLPSTVT